MKLLMKPLQNLYRNKKPTCRKVSRKPHQNAVGVNSLYFNNFLFRLIEQLVDQEAHPTAFLFQKLGFAGVS